MSQQPETELDLELQLLPAWAKQGTETNRFANYRGDEEVRSWMKAETWFSAQEAVDAGLADRIVDKV